MDISRNCSLLPPTTPKNSDFYMLVRDKRYNVCPKSIVDNHDVNLAIEAHEFYSSGFLPEEGTIYDQTQFFVRASLIMKSKLKQLEAEAYEVTQE